MLLAANWQLQEILKITEFGENIHFNFDKEIKEHGTLSKILKYFLKNKAHKDHLCLLCSEPMEKWISVPTLLLANSVK